MKEKISVIMSVYNDEKNIANAVESILCQTYENFELLILDESTANLDKESTLKIFDLLREKDITIINSTHDPKKFFDVDEEIRIVIQDEKRIIEIHKLKR